MLTLPTIFIGSPIISDIDKPPFVTNKQHMLSTPPKKSKYLQRIFLSLMTLGISEFIKFIHRISSIKKKSYYYSIQQNNVQSYNYDNQQPIINQKILSLNLIRKTIGNIQQTLTSIKYDTSLSLIKYKLIAPQIKISISNSKSKNIETSVTKKISKELKITIIKEKVLAGLHNELKNKNIQLDEMISNLLLHSEYSTIISLALYPTYDTPMKINQLIKRLVEQVNTRYLHITHSIVNNF